MNVALLTRVRRSIVLAPDRFCAAQWAFARNAGEVLRHGAPTEGFRCCIAGRVLLEGEGLSRRELLQKGGFHTGGGVWKRAAHAAALDGDQARRLFFPSQWDRPYKQQYYLCGRDEEATLAGSYIEYFVDEYGASSRSPVPRTAVAGVEADRPARASGQGSRDELAPSRSARTPA